jgi:hypothetical protein
LGSTGFNGLMLTKQEKSNRLTERFSEFSLPLGITKFV